MAKKKGDSINLDLSRTAFQQTLGGQRTRPTISSMGRTGLLEFLQQQVDPGRAPIAGITSQDVMGTPLTEAEVASLSPEARGTISRLFGQQQAAQPPIEKLPAGVTLPEFQQPLKVGTFGGSVIGNVPIFVGEGGLFPAGITDARERALATAAAARQEKIKEFGAIERPEGPAQFQPRIDTEFQTFLNNSFNQAFKSGGLQGVSNLLNPLTPEGQLFGERRQQFKTLARNLTNVNELSKDILDDFKSKDKFVSSNTFNLANQIQAASKDIQGLVFEDRNFEGILSNLVSSADLDLVVDNRLKNVRDQITSEIVVLKRKGLPKNLIVAKIKKKFLDPKDQARIAQEVFEDPRIQPFHKRETVANRIGDAFNTQIDKSFFVVRTQPLSGGAGRFTGVSLFGPGRDVFNESFDVNNQAFNIVNAFNAGDIDKKEALKRIKNVAQNTTIDGRRFVAEWNDPNKLNEEQLNRTTLVGNMKLAPGTARQSQEVNLANALVFDGKKQQFVTPDRDTFVQGRVVGISFLPLGEATTGRSLSFNEVMSDPGALANRTSLVRVRIGIGDLTQNQTKAIEQFSSRSALSDLAQETGAPELPQWAILQFDLNDDVQVASLDELVGTSFIKKFFGGRAEEGEEKELELGQEPTLVGGESELFGKVFKKTE